MSSSLEYLSERCIPPRRQSQQSCALWRAMLALAALAHGRNNIRYFVPALRDGGAYRDRTDDLMLAKQPLSQLS